jgi:hypothetical protein
LPVLANLFMHYAVDMWMAREVPVGCWIGRSKGVPQAGPKSRFPSPGVRARNRVDGK